MSCLSQLLENILRAMKTYHVILALFFLALTSCEKDKIEGRISKDASLANELRSVDEELSIDGHTYFLNAGVARDFMPGSYENGSPMMGGSDLTDKDTLDMDNGIFLKKQYVVKGNEIWIADFSEVSLVQSHVLRGTVRNGPKWGPDITVDIVCEFQKNGTTYQIIAKSQTILKVE